MARRSGRVDPGPAGSATLAAAEAQACWAAERLRRSALGDDPHLGRLLLARRPPPRLSASAERADAGEYMLAVRLRQIAALAEKDVDAAVRETERLVASLHGEGGGALMVAQAQASTLIEVIEAALAGLELSPEQLERGRVLVAEGLRRAAVVGEREPLSGPAMRASG